ncbi:MAG: guanine deaminase [Halieaceae bacterium]|nr:guanine deaminase [Halieaceae bacterium]
MSRCLHRGALLHFLDDPGTAGDEAWVYHDDGALLIEEGLIAAAGDAGDVLAGLDPATPCQWHRDALLVPGFIDTHVHYPQLDIMGAHGEQLLEWLERYVFPAEARFGDYDHARAVAERFLGELLRNGTTTALVFGTVHPQSVDAFFDAAEGLGLRMIAGKVLMDRNAPAYLRDDPESGYRDSRDLIERWHGRGRMSYAVTPRFAPTSSTQQLAMAGQLLCDFPGVYLHTHMSENLNEVAWVQELFPHVEHYLNSYDEAGLLGRRSVFAHCIHLSDAEWERMAQAGCGAAFCPTSNLFLGSGLFPLREAERHGVRVGLGTDIGAGTSLSLLRTIDEAYKVQQLQGYSLGPMKSFYLATLGGVRVLDLEDRLGNFLPGKEADFLVLDLAPTPLLAQRLANSGSLSETLFVLSTLGDDRCVRETWIMGQRRYQRSDRALSL